MTEIDMKGNPFFLDEEGENWVLDTWKNMSLEQKCGQVFCPMGFNGEEETLKHFTQDIQVGGLMYRADSAENIQDIYRKLQAFSNIPLLLAANTEAGGDGPVSYTHLAAGMQKATSGRMTFKKQSWEPVSMIDALQNGIGMVVQELSLIHIYSFENRSGNVNHISY